MIRVKSYEGVERGGMEYGLGNGIEAYLQNKNILPKSKEKCMLIRDRRKSII